MKRFTLVIVLAIIMLSGVPALAHAATAKAITKLTINKAEFEVDNSAATTPTAPVVTGRLYAFNKGLKRWYPASGPVRLYLRNQDTGAWKLVGTDWISTKEAYRFTLSRRGEYQVRYNGNTYRYSSRKTTERYDYIGARITTATVGMSVVDTDYARVTITYDFAWDTTKATGGAAVTNLGYFSSEATESVTSTSSAEHAAMWMAKKPGAQSYSYIVRREEVLTYYWLMGVLMFEDEYIDDTPSFTKTYSFDS